MAGPLFRELSEDLAMVWKPSMLYTGHPDSVCRNGGSCLHIKSAPGYDRRNHLCRLLSWMKYFFKAVKIIWRQPKNSLLFIVSNPPFLGFAGLFFKLIRRQQYVVLIHDIYPDLLIALGRLQNGFFARCWDFFNRLVYENANLVMTISQDMVKRLEKKLDISKANNKKVVCIPPWADIVAIRPIDKEQNWFAAKYHLLGKTTVLYSGNMGHTHDIESILAAARRLKGELEIHFVFIGEGAKWALVEKTIREFHLKNVTLLRFQPEEIIPYSIASCDIGIVAYLQGTEDCMVSSKICYYMAAGLSPLVVCDRETDLTNMVREKECGIRVKSGDADSMVRAIKEFHANPERLKRYKIKARKAAEILYSRKNSALFVEALKVIV